MHVCRSEKLGSRSSHFPFAFRLIAAFAFLAGTAGSAWAAKHETLILYSGQHPQVVQMLTQAFQKQTGILVKTHSGEGPEIANQLLREGKSSPADLVFVENSPEILLLDEHHLLAPVAQTTLVRVPADDNASDGRWLGVLARENVLAYNPSILNKQALPDSLMALAGPAWKGKVAIAPSDADFLPVVSAVLHLKGKKAALGWLKGLKENANVYQDDEGVVAAVNRGAMATGIINNYYWARLHTELGAARMHSAIHHFAPGDVGNLVNISAAGLLKSSKHKAEAQRFLAFLVSRKAQTMLAHSTVDFEYPLVAGVAPNPLLTPFKALHPAPISPANLGDDRAAAALLQQAGLL